MLQITLLSNYGKSQTVRKNTLDADYRPWTGITLSSTFAPSLTIKTQILW